MNEFTGHLNIVEFKIDIKIEINYFNDFSAQFESKYVKIKTGYNQHLLQKQAVENESYEQKSSSL